MRAIATASLMLLLATPALAELALKPPLAPIAFLVGNWDQGEGKVAETGGTSRGGSIISIESDGAALLRRDHTELFDKAGKTAGGFHQTMLIYPDGNTLKADYVDGEGHAIHYVSADVVAGKSVAFTSAPGQGPVFKLMYELKAPGTLAVTFGMTPPGAADFRPIATGTLKKMK
jgi:hypothetical protein